MKSSNTGSVYRQLKQHEAKGTFPTHLNGIKAFKFQVVKEFTNTGTLKDLQAKLDNAAKKYQEEALNLEIQVKKAEWHQPLKLHSPLAYMEKVNSICSAVDWELAAHVMFTIPITIGRSYGTPREPGKGPSISELMFGDRVTNLDNQDMLDVINDEPADLNREHVRAFLQTLTALGKRITGTQVLE